MKEKKIFTIVGIVCILLAVFVVVYQLITKKPLSVISFLPFVFAVACLICARTIK